MDKTAVIAQRAADISNEQSGLVENITESLSQFKIEHEGASKTARKPAKASAKKTKPAAKALPAKEAEKN